MLNWANKGQAGLCKNDESGLDDGKGREASLFEPKFAKLKSQGVVFGKGAHIIA